MTTLKTILVGCGGMGRNQARILNEREEFDLVAVCDLMHERAQAVAAELGVAAYGDFAEALVAEKPDVAAICTANASHAPLTIMAAEHGVRGVYCEKPMATNMADARHMVEICEQHGAKLVINHQRRIGPDLIKAKELIDAGAIGQVDLIRGNCAGDILSDGTHAIDSMLWLAGDGEVDWVVGQIHREINDAMIERAQKQSEKYGIPVEPGTRYGHPVENGGIAVFGLKSTRDDGRFIKCELSCGDLRDLYRAYQDYEIFGDKGRIWRCGDKAPNLFIDDGRGGEMAAGLGEDWAYRPQPGDPGPWRAVDVPETDDKGIPAGYRRFAALLNDGTPHPMDAANAIRGFEVVMAIYESARIQKKIVLPLQQDRFPLELMLEDTQ